MLINKLEWKKIIQTKKHINPIRRNAYLDSRVSHYNGNVMIHDDVGRGEHYISINHWAGPSFTYKTTSLESSSRLSKVTVMVWKCPLYVLMLETELNTSVGCIWKQNLWEVIVLRWMRMEVAGTISCFIRREMGYSYTCSELPHDTLCTTVARILSSKEMLRPWS